MASTHSAQKRNSTRELGRRFIWLTINCFDRFYCKSILVNASLFWGWPSYDFNSSTLLEKQKPDEHRLLHSSSPAQSQQMTTVRPLVLLKSPRVACLVSSRARFGDVYSGHIESSSMCRHRRDHCVTSLSSWRDFAALLTSDTQGKKQ